MKHFSEEAWADFVRGVGPAELAPELQRHLDSGCEKCLKSIAMWRSILEIARDETGPPPPESAVRGAEACYGLYRRRESLAPVPTLAELVFDSFRQPVPAGARSSVMSGRQLLYESDGVDIDIRTHFDTDANRIFLTGQVLNPGEPNANMKGISVIVVDKSGALAQTVTTASGEFQLEFDRGQNAWLKIDRREERPIVMVLGDLEPMKKSISEHEGDLSKDSQK